MADLKVKISEFPPATQSKDSDEIAILQDGINKRIKTPKIEEKILEKVSERFVNKNQLGVNNGVATLGSDGILSVNQRPALNVQANFIPINLLSPKSDVDGVFVPTESGVYENYGNIEIDLNDGTYIITKIGEQYEKSLLAVQSPKSVNTISELRSREGDFEGQIITLLGYYEAGEKEPLNYKWTSEQGIDDGGAVINTESGSWEVVFSNYLGILDFGGVGDGVTDNTLMIEKALRYCSLKKIQLVVTEGVFRMTRTVNIYNGYVDVLSNKGVFGIIISHDYLMSTTPVSGLTTQSPMFSFFNCEYISLNNIEFYTDKTLFENELGENIGEWNHHIRLDNCSNININKCKSTNPNGDFISLAGTPGDDFKVNRNVVISNNKTIEPIRLGVAIINAIDVIVSGNIHTGIDDQLKQSPVYGSFLDIEPERYCYAKNINIYDNYITNGSIDIYSRKTYEDRTDNIIIRYNTINQGRILSRGGNNVIIATNNIRTNFTDGDINPACIYISQATSELESAGVNKNFNVFGNIINVSGDDLRRGIYISSLIDSSVYDNRINGAKYGIHVLTGLNVDISKNTIRNCEQTIYINNLFPLRYTLGVIVNSKNVSVVNNMLYGSTYISGTVTDPLGAYNLIFNENTVYLEEEQEVLFNVGNNVEGYFKKNNIKLKTSNTTSAALRATGASNTINLVLENNDIDSDSYGIYLGTICNKYKIDNNKIISKNTPIHFGNGGLYAEITNNRLGSKSETPQYAVNFLLTSNTGVLANNTLLSNFSEPFYVRNVNIKKTNQRLETITSPNVGWMSGKIWADGDVAYNINPLITANDPKKWVRISGSWVSSTPNATNTVKGFVNQSSNVIDVTTADATDLATSLTLVNELKSKLNAKLTADRNSGQQVI